MTPFIQIPERIVLAGDMAHHWAVALVSTESGLIASMHLDYSRENARYKNITRGERVQMTIDRIIEFANEYVHNVHEAIFEEPTPKAFDSAGPQWQMATAFLTAAHRLGAREAKTQAWPGTVKKWATENGGAQKHVMTERANELAGEGYPPIRDHNEADAVCIGFWYAEQIKAREINAIAWRLQREAEAS